MIEYKDINSNEDAMKEAFKDYLDADEEIIGVFKPNKKRYYWSYWMFLIPAFWPHLILATIFTLGFFPFVFAKKGYENLCYAYTNKRIIVRSGSMGINYRSIDYKDIIATEADISYMDRKYNTGTISFRTQHQGVGFRYIENPYDVLREMREYMENK